MRPNRRTISEHFGIFQKLLTTFLGRDTLDILLYVELWKLAAIQTKRDDGIKDKMNQGQDEFLYRVI